MGLLQWKDLQNWFSSFWILYESTFFYFIFFGQSIDCFFFFFHISTFYVIFSSNIAIIRCFWSKYRSSIYFYFLDQKSTAVLKLSTIILCSLGNGIFSSSKFRLSFVFQDIRCVLFPLRILSTYCTSHPEFLFKNSTGLLHFHEPVRAACQTLVSSSCWRRQWFRVALSKRSFG